MSQRWIVVGCLVSLVWVNVPRPCFAEDVQQAVKAESRHGGTLPEGNATTTGRKPMQGLYWMVGYRDLIRSSSDVRYRNSFRSRIKDNLQRNHSLSGISIAVPWKVIEPKEGAFDFSRVDEIVEMASAHKMPYKVILVPGQWTPEFVYEKGAEDFQTKVSNSDRPNFGERLTIPLPWNPVYRKFFFRAVRQFADKYRDDPHCVCVAVTVANFMSPEWHLPKTPEDVRKWDAYDNAKQKIKECWIEAIDAFATLFPEQQICLEGSSTPLARMEHESDAILEYGIKRCNRRFTIQTNQLHGRDDNHRKTNRSYQRILRYKDRLHHGFQNVASLRPRFAKRQGTMEMTVYNYIQAEAEYLELWWGDGGDVALCEKLQTELAEAKRLGVNGYQEKLIGEGKFADHDEASRK